MKFDTKETSSKAKVLAEKKRKRKERESRLLAKKPYLELVTAILSIPVLITVIILNFTNLRNINKTQTTPTPAGNIFFSNPEATTEEEKECLSEIGPVEIISPEEGDTLTTNPVTIDVSHDDEKYCGVVWSYQINGEGWSSYDDKAIALYNLSQGDIKVELRVKSITGNEQTTLTRNFRYQGKTTVATPEPEEDPTPSISPSPSPQL
ncbi:MAG: hypothetical protein AAB553_01115 [Patescibacteria group bacterium]